MRRTFTSLVIALAAAVSMLAVVPPAPAAAAGMGETGTTVYTLNPAKDRLDVKITLKVKNNEPDTTSSYICTKYYYDYWAGYIPYTATCSTTTHWYYTTTVAWVETDATNVRAVSGGSKLQVSMGIGGVWFRSATITFPKLFYGKSRAITITYSVPGGAPRSDSTIRTLRAYSSFCATANGQDGGNVTIKIPKDYLVETSGDPVKPTSANGYHVYTSGPVGDITTWYACFDGVNEKGYRVETLTAAGGRRIELRSWPEDPAWTAGVKKEIDKGLPELVTLIGSELAGSGTLVVKEAATGSEYAGFYDRDTNTVTVGEDFRQPSLVQHELAHTWFNQGAFAEVWLDEGFAEWAGRTASGEESACTIPSGSATPTLATWKYLKPRSTADERQAVADQYEAACYIITTVAGAAGDARMTAAIQALLDRKDPYAADPAITRPTKVATWKDWLDAMDQVALAGSGAKENLASDLLLQFGVTSDRSLLAKRTAARRAYQQLIATVSGWTVPPVVRTPLTAWNFDAAQDALTAAGDTWELTGETDLVLPAVDARHGPAATAWQDAQTVDDLTQAADLAQRQLNAATSLADTIALVSQPRDALQAIGLLGTSVPSTDTALAAVKSGDLDTASDAITHIRAVILGSREEGVRRLAIAVAVILMLVVLLAIVLVVRGRSRRSSTAQRVSLTPGSAGAPGSVIVVSPTTSVLTPGAAPGSGPGSAPGSGPGAAPGAAPRDDAPTQVWAAPAPRSYTWGGSAAPTAPSSPGSPSSPSPSGTDAPTDTIPLPPPPPPPPPAPPFGPS